MKIDTEYVGQLRDLPDPDSNPDLVIRKKEKSCNRRGVKGRRWNWRKGKKKDKYPIFSSENEKDDKFLITWRQAKEWLALNMTTREDLKQRFNIKFHSMEEKEECLTLFKNKNNEYPIAENFIQKMRKYISDAGIVTRSDFHYLLNDKENWNKDEADENPEEFYIRVTFKTTKGEYGWLKDICSKNNITITKFIRAMLFNYSIIDDRSNYNHKKYIDRLQDENKREV